MGMELRKAASVPWKIVNYITQNESSETFLLKTCCSCMEIIDNWILSFFFYGFLYLYLVLCMNDKHWSRRPGYEALFIYICDLITHVSE